MTAKREVTVQAAVLDSRTPSTRVDSGATSNGKKVGDPIKEMGRKSDTVFVVPTGNTALDSDVVLVHHTL